MFKPKTAILVTGGMDSTTLLYDFIYSNPDQEPPILISMDYGQAAFPKQVEMLNIHQTRLQLKNPLVILKHEFPKWQRKEALFDPATAAMEENPLEEWDQLRYERYFIEGRNATMVLAALAYCSAHKIDQLLAGYLYHESEWARRRTYKLMTGDNSPQFVDTMNLLSQVGFSHQVRFRAPFYERYLSKADVAAIGMQRYGIDYARETHTCYFPVACGKCDNCLLRAEILGEGK